MSTVPENPPIFSVIRGHPTEEELAALVAVLALRSAADQERPATQTGWSAYWRSVRAPVQPGPEAWRMSGRPG